MPRADFVHNKIPKRQQEVESHHKGAANDYGILPFAQATGETWN